MNIQRYDEGWEDDPGMRKDDNGAYVLFSDFDDATDELEERIAKLEAALVHEYNEEWDVGDGITDAAKVQFLIDRIPK